MNTPYLDLKTYALNEDTTRFIDFRVQLMGDTDSNMTKLDAFANQTNINVGDITVLETDDKSNLVNAINEIKNGTISSEVAQRVIEHNKDKEIYFWLGTKEEYEVSTAKDDPNAVCILTDDSGGGGEPPTEINGADIITQSIPLDRVIDGASKVELGNITSLTTTNKSSVVGAINEIQQEIITITVNCGTF